jgi:hypothetical protein
MRELVADAARDDAPDATRDEDCEVSLDSDDDDDDDVVLTAEEDDGSGTGVTTEVESFDVSMPSATDSAPGGGGGGGGGGGIPSSLVAEDVTVAKAVTGVVSIVVDVDICAAAATPSVTSPPPRPTPSSLSSLPCCIASSSRSISLTFAASILRLLRRADASHSRLPPPTVCMKGTCILNRGKIRMNTE